MEKAKILVVEDDEIVATDIQEGLETLGYDVSAVVSSGEEALKKIEETHPDLVLMDIVLKGSIDGVETAKEIRDRFNIPVVYLTAYADENTLDRAKITEPFGYLLKPFEERELHTSIEMALYKHEKERKLKESKEWLATTLKSIGDAVIVTDKNGFVAFMNPVAEVLTGWKQEEALGKDLKEVINIVDEKTRTLTESPVTKALLKGAAVGLSNHILITRDGRETSIDDSAAPIRDDKGNIIGVVLVFQDATERKLAEEQLESSRDQLRNLAARLESMREEEIGRIAHEIREELGQALAGLKMNLSWLDKKLSETGDQVPRSILLEEITSMSKLIDTTIQTMQEISTELRPRVLDDFGLKAAIEWQAQQFQTRMGIRCRFTSSPENITLDKNRSTAIFRILQEALTNVARHANATRVDISLKKKADNLILEIKDNGKGITESEISNPSSLGLLGMQERAFLLGGEVKIRDTPGKGTAVTVRIPLER